MDRRVEERRRNYKKPGCVGDDPRRRREEQQVQIRKQERDARLSKRRAGTGTDGCLEQHPTGMGFNGALTLENLEVMVAGVFSDITAKQLESAQQFRKVLSIEKNPPIQQVIDSGVVPRFVEFLKFEQWPDLQFEAAWALTNIASGSAEQTRIVIEHGAIPIFVQLLSCGHDEVREQAVWALGNIAGDSAGCRDLVLQAGGLTPLLTRLHETDKQSMLRNATWTVSNLCRGKPAPKFEHVRGSLPTLATLIRNSDVEVLTDACWALSYLSDGENERIDAVIRAGVVPRMIELLLHPSPLVQTPALRTIGNIVTGDDIQTEEVIKNHALPNLLKLMSSDKKGIRREACWTVSNITAGNKEQIQEVIANNLVPHLVQLLSTEEFDVKKEAAFALSNAASGGTALQVEYFVSCGLIGPLLDLLTIQDTKIVNVVLEAFENILRTGKQKQKENGLEENPYCALIEELHGLTKLEFLQESPHEEIYQKALRIITNYFPFEEEGESEGFNSFNSGGFDACAPSGGFNFAQ